MYIRMPTILVISKLTVTICKYLTNFIIVLSLQRNYNVFFFTQILIYTVIMSHWLHCLFKILQPSLEPVKIIFKNNQVLKMVEYLQCMRIKF